MDAKSKDNREQGNYLLVGSPVEPPKRRFFLIEMVMSIWEFKAGLYMMITALAW
jgi:hypothetical protein